jgi:hypothetical protein
MAFTFLFIGYQQTARHAADVSRYAIYYVIRHIVHVLDDMVLM